MMILGKTRLRPRRVLGAAAFAVALACSGASWIGYSQGLAEREAELAELKAQVAAARSALIEARRERASEAPAEISSFAWSLVSDAAKKSDEHPDSSAPSLVVPAFEQVPASIVTVYSLPSGVYTTELTPEMITDLSLIGGEEGVIRAVTNEAQNLVWLRGASIVADGPQIENTGSVLFQTSTSEAMPIMGFNLAIDCEPPLREESGE